jgi:hypothetical protein
MRLVLAISDTLPSPELMSSFPRPIVLSGAQAKTPQPAHPPARRSLQSS